MADDLLAKELFLVCDKSLSLPLMYLLTVVLTDERFTVLFMSSLELFQLLKSPMLLQSKGLPSILFTIERLSRGTILTEVDAEGLTNFSSMFESPVEIILRLRWRSLSLSSPRAYCESLSNFHSEDTSVSRVIFEE